MKTIGDHVRKKRLELGLLQRDAAQHIGVATDTVTNWEKGRTSPRLHLFPKIIEFLGYTPNQVKDNTLGERIVQMRRALGIRQDQLAVQLGIDPSTVARWEKNNGRPASTNQAKLDPLIHHFYEEP